MKVLLDIEDKNASFVLELLKNFSFVKVKTLTASKAQVLEDLKEAVENMKLVKKGKMKARPAKELASLLGKI